MELRNYWAIYIGIILVIVFVILYILLRKNSGGFRGGIRIANITLLEEDPYFKKKQKIYKIVSAMILGFLMVSIIAASVLMSRPYTSKKVTKNKYCRDIMLCLDVSTSVDNLNMHLVDELKDVVASLQGERVGIVIFNTSPVLITPLTDDYEYVIEQLDTIKTALKERNKFMAGFNTSDDYYFYDSYISSGTLIGNAERGSSLIGDGLASSITCFTGEEVARTKIVIFCTDNDPYGDGYVDITKAAQMCADNKITVYGVGTKEMYHYRMEEMEEAVKLTGGKFYLEEESGSFKEIVDAIEASSANKVKGKSYVVETDQPKTAFIFVIIGMLGVCVARTILRK